MGGMHSHCGTVHIHMLWRMGLENMPSWVVCIHTVGPCTFTCSGGWVWRICRHGRYAFTLWDRAHSHALEDGFGEYAVMGGMHSHCGTVHIHMLWRMGLENMPSWEVCIHTVGPCTFTCSGGWVWRICRHGWYAFTLWDRAHSHAVEDGFGEYAVMGGMHSHCGTVHIHMLWRMGLENMPSWVVCIHTVGPCTFTCSGGWVWRICRHGRYAFTLWDRAHSHALEDGFGEYAVMGGSGTVHIHMLWRMGLENMPSWVVCIHTVGPCTFTCSGGWVWRICHHGRYAFTLWDRAHSHALENGFGGYAIMGGMHSHCGTVHIHIVITFLP